MVQVNETLIQLNLAPMNLRGYKYKFTNDETLLLPLCYPLPTLEKYLTQMRGAGNNGGYLISAYLQCEFSNKHFTNHPFYVFYTYK